jgi:hypothetical protein
MENIVEPKTTRGRKKENITDYERYERQKERVRIWKYNKRRDDEEYRLKLNEANRIYHQNIRDNDKAYLAQKEGDEKDKQAKSDKN